MGGRLGEQRGESEKKKKIENFTNKRKQGIPFQVEL